MSELKGTNMAAPAVPLTDANTYPVHHSICGKDGFKTVGTILERDSIPSNCLEVPTLCYVKEVNMFYEWGGASWINKQFAEQGETNELGEKGYKKSLFELKILDNYTVLGDLEAAYPNGPTDGKSGLFKVGDTLYLWSGSKYEPLNLDIYPTFSIEQFVDITPLNGDINVKYDKSPYAKVTLSGESRIFNLTIDNTKDGDTGKILVFQTGFKQISVSSNIKGTIDLPLNENTIVMLTYNVLGSTIYMYSNVVLGDIQYSSPQRIVDFDVTYYDNSVCSVIWSAPYANNIYDNVTEYDMRYSNSEVNADDPLVWNGLRKVPYTPTPLAPGKQHKMVITKLEPNKEYYIYLKSIKINYGISYESKASNFVYCKTKGGISDGGGYHRIELNVGMLYPAKRNVSFVDQNGVRTLASIGNAVDELEKDQYLEDGYLDTRNKTYETGWTPRISAIDNPYELTIDINSRHVLDRLYLYCTTKSLYRIFISSDLGAEREYVYTSDRIYNGFSTIDLKGKVARMIHIQYDDDMFAIQEDVAEGEEVYPTRNNMNSVGNIQCLRLYGRQISDKPASIMPPARRTVADRTVDEIFCTNGHFYQQGRIHSKCSGTIVRLYGALGHFCPPPTETDYKRIADFQVRINKVSWVYSNNGLEVYFRELLEKTYKKYGLKPIITGTSILDQCRWPGWADGKKNNRQIDNYWLPDKWRPLPTKQVRGFVKYQEETTNPLNYKTLSKVCNHLAAIYGDLQVDPNQLDVFPLDESKESGLDLITSVEFDNEPDKTWEGWMGYTNGEEFAAQISAVYDGHCGDIVDEDGIKNKYGVRNVNATQLMVSPGMCGINTGYMRTAYEWCKRNRKDGKFPTDVLNFHSYFSNIGNQAGDNTIPIQYAVTFEEALTGEASEFIKINDYRNRNLPDKEIWITEFGYGESGGRNTQSKYQCYTQPGRQIGNFIVPDRHRADVKGAWIIRAVLGMMELGVNLVHYYSTEMEGNYFSGGQWGHGGGYEMFHWNDCKDLTPGAKAEAIKKYEQDFARGGFATTGLFGPLLGCGGYPISRAYWWIATYRHRLKGYVYTGRKYLEDARVSIACFRKVNEEKGAYIVWMNTSINDGIPNVEIPIPEGLQFISKVETYVPEIPSPESLPNDIVYDQQRTGLPTSRREKYINGKWVIQNKKPDTKNWESFSQEPAVYPENPKEGDEVTVLPTREENPFFPIVGPVAGKISKHGQNPGSNQYERIATNDPVNPDGTDKWGMATNVYLAWRQVDAVCDFIDYTEEGQHGQRGDETTLESLRNCIVDNVTEFPVYYFFDKVPDPDYVSNVSDLTGVTINSSSIKLYWNNYNYKDTGYEIFVSELPESGYSPLKEVPIGVENSTVINGLNPDSTYYFKIRPRMGAKAGNLSDYTSVRTYSEVPVPTNLRISGNSVSTIKLNWDYVEGQVADFVYYSVYRGDGTGAFAMVGKIDDISVREFTDTGLKIGTYYEYKIRVVGLNGQSDYTPELKARTMTAEECSPIPLQIVTDKLGSKIKVVFDLDLKFVEGNPKHKFIITEDGSERLITLVSRDESNLKTLILDIPQDSLKDYDKRTDIRISYVGGSGGIMSNYGVDIDPFSNIKVTNIIGNYTNIEASFKINFMGPTHPLPTATDWNNVIGEPEKDNVSCKLTDIYGRPSNIYINTFKESPKYVWGSVYDNGSSGFEDIEANICKYVWRGPSGKSNNTENVVSRMYLTGVSDERRYTVKLFGATTYGSESFFKMKINDQYSNSLAQKGNKTTFLTLENCQPKDGVLNIDIINDIEENFSGAGTPVMSFMLLDEFKSGSEPENKNVWIRETFINEAEDGTVKFPEVTIHLNCIGVATQYRVAETDDFTNIYWIDILNDELDVPYTLSEGYEMKKLYVQVKNNFSESNIRSIEVDFRDPYIPLVLKNIFINNNDSETYDPNVTVLVEKDGVPTHYKISENPDLSLVPWTIWSDPKSSNIRYTLSEGRGTKTVYVMIKDAIVESAIKVDAINYIVLIYKDVILHMDVPAGTDLNTVELSFAPLKYNKKFAYSITSDDTHVSAWNVIFKYFNGMWMDNLNYFHKYDQKGVLNKRTTGAYAPRALTYTDGFGVKRRFSVGGANDVCPDKIIRPDNAGGDKYPYLLWAEIEEMLEFDGGFSLHDTWDPAYGNYGGAVENIVAGIHNYNDYLKKRFGRKAIVMTEPNGDAKYTTAATIVSDIKMITRQHNDGLGYVFVSLKDPNLNIDKLKVARMFIESPVNGVETYKSEFLKEFPGDGMYGEFGCHGADKNKDVEKKNWPAVSGFFDWLCDTYGEPGDDSIWFGTNEEIIQYKILCARTRIAKSIDGSNLKVTLSVPELDNFNWSELTLLVNGVIPSGVNESDNVKGLSYGLKEDVFMININLDNTLEIRTEKYVSAFEKSFDNDDKVAAEYFVQRLKKQLQASYIDRINSVATPPLLSVFNILKSGIDSDVTESPEIEVNYVTDGKDTHYMISEYANFAGAEWKSKPLDNAIFYTLSNAIGLHTLYFKVKSQFGESNTLSDSITYTPPAFSLVGISINNGDYSTPIREVKVGFIITGIEAPTHYMLSEDPELKGAVWMPFTNPAEYTLTVGNGEKKIYSRLKTVSEESGIKSNSIVLNIVEKKVVFIPRSPSTGVNRELLMANGEAINMVKHINNYAIKLAFNDGSESDIAFYNDSSIPGANGIQNVSANPEEPIPYEGIYTYEAVKTTAYYEVYNQPEPIVPHRYIFNVPLGTYKIRILGSTKNLTGAVTTNKFYECNGVQKNPSHSLVNNFTNFIELDDVTPNENGKLIVRWWGNPTRSAMCCLNLIEIIKKG